MDVLLFLSYICIDRMQCNCCSFNFLVSTSSFIVNITWIFSWARVGNGSPDRTFVRLYLFNASLGLGNGICVGPKLGVDAVNAF